MAEITRSFTFSGSVPVPPTIDNVLTVFGVPEGAAVTKITVSNLNIAHTWDDDLDISLIDPDGNAIVLSSDNGALGINYTNTTFDDDAANAPITGGVAPFTGVFQPEESLASLIPGIVNGNWTLNIVDDFPGIDDGTLTSWTLNITYEVSDKYIFGTDADETILGDAAENALFGLDGDDLLGGGEDRDDLWGGMDDDTFYFAEMGSNNKDKIYDWEKKDQIALEVDVFDKIGGDPGDRLMKKYFENGGKANDEDDRILTKLKKNGDVKVFYDSNGDESGNKSIIAIVKDPDKPLKAKDFELIDM